MGKAKRSKNKRNKSKQSRQGGGPTSIPDGANLPLSSSEGSAGILGRIRHGDPRVRLGALTALSATILDADNLIAASSSEGSAASASKKKQISDGLLKAISERVMDPDIPVAINAAGCVSNYATFSADVEEGNVGIATGASGTTSTRNPAVLGGLGEVLLGRIARCQTDIARYGQELAQLSSQASSDSNNNIRAAGNAANKMEKTMRKLEEQWTLAHLCLSGLAALVERSPTALERFGGAGHHANLIGSISGTISIAGQFLEQSSSPTNDTTAADAAAPTAPASVAIDEATIKAVSDAATSAARCIHSALDENPALLQSVAAATNAGATAPPLQVLLSAVNAGSMPALARLHSAGALITARHLLPRTFVEDDSASSSTADLQSKLNEMDGMLSAHALPLLAQYLQYQPTIATALIARISTTQSEKDAEVEDAKIERQVQKAVDGRKESARSIARRQKAIKDEKKKTAEQAARDAVQHGSAAAMMEDSSSTRNSNSVPGTPSSMAGDNDQQDESNVVESAEDLYDRAVEAWRSSCLPLKLAVEVAANLCAGSGTSNNGDAQDGDEEDEMMWDSDDEDKLVAESSEIEGGVDKEAQERDKKLFGEVIRLNIPNRVVEVVVNIATAHSGETSMPDVAVCDLVELLSKCGVCGANAAGNLHAWATKADEAAQLWNVLCGVVRNSPTSRAASNELIVAGKGAAIAMILALLRNRPGLISSVGKEDLNAVLALLGIENGGENCTDARRDCIALLGILCSEPHPLAVNASICDAFLTILSREDEEIGIISEILNSIMDMYSLDETDEGNHDATFSGKNVLAALQAVLPNFKKRIALERVKADAESVEVWKETALNAKRFIQYKKNKKDFPT